MNDAQQIRMMHIPIETDAFVGKNDIFTKRRTRYLTGTPERGSSGLGQETGHEGDFLVTLLAYLQMNVNFHHLAYLHSRRAEWAQHG
jgi:hypothetical protein